MPKNCKKKKKNETKKPYFLAKSISKNGKSKTRPKKYPSHQCISLVYRQKS